MSGGVDSSVAAYLLKQQGYDVVGLFMRNWNDAQVTLEDECPWIDDSRDAMMVAEQLGIPFQVIDFSESYKKRIVDYMFSEYERGRTPNPDVLCNREIKFDLFLKEALKLGADKVATGHYVRKEVIKSHAEQEEYRLLRGIDSNKDQSYFLCQLNQYQLSKALFPIGELEKSKVRDVAQEIGLVTADKKDSQGLCFIGKVSLPEFLQQQLKPKKGRVIEVSDTHPDVLAYAKQIQDQPNAEGAITRLKLYPEMGKVIGEHRGAHYYTRGQRRGLDIGGKPKPLFVLQTDVENNVIYVGQGEEHPALHYRGLKIKVEDIHILRDSGIDLYDNRHIYSTQIRYRQKPFNSHIERNSKGDVIVVFSELQKNVTPGQFVTLYNQEELLISGVIS
jgi:tRNA-specific 2-thiouridylase